MKTNKFRGKPYEDLDLDEINVHIPKDDYIYGNLIANNGFPYIVGDVVEADCDYIQLEQWVPVRPETVSQFTGLLDKNGKEIYEGDKIKVVSHTTMISDGKRTTFESRIYEVVSRKFAYMGKLVAFGFFEDEPTEMTGVLSPIYHYLHEMGDDFNIIGEKKNE